MELFQVQSRNFKKICRVLLFLYFLIFSYLDKYNGGTKFKTTTTTEEKKKKRFNKMT